MARPRLAVPNVSLTVRIPEPVAAYFEMLAGEAETTANAEAAAVLEAHARMAALLNSKETP